MTKEQANEAVKGRNRSFLSIGVWEAYQWQHRYTVIKACVNLGADPDMATAIMLRETIQLIPMS